MLSLHRNALSAALLCCCLPLCLLNAASAQGTTKYVAFGTTITPQMPCPPGVPCVMLCGFPPPIDFLPEPGNLISLLTDGTISAPHLAQTVLATNSGVVNGLIFESANAQRLGTPTLEQVTLRFNYDGPLVFSTDIPGYDLTGEDLGSVRVVTLTAEPGTSILLGSPVKDALGRPTLEAWNLESVNPTDTGVPAAFYSSTLTGQGFGVSQTPEPGSLALLGGLLALSGAAWRRKRR